jgi:hypothetical protein
VCIHIWSYICWRHQRVYSILWNIWWTFVDSPTGWILLLPTRSILGIWFIGSCKDELLKFLFIVIIIILERQFFL